MGLPSFFATLMVFHCRTKVSGGVGEAAGLDDGLEKREYILLQGKVRLGTVRVRVGPRQDTDIFSNLLQCSDGTAGRSRDAVSGYIEIINYKQYFHCGRKDTDFCPD